MSKELKYCPVCGSKLMITEYQCPSCGTKISGEFYPEESVIKLSDEQMEILKIFVASYGNIGEVARYLGVSRPTAKARIRQIGEALGAEPYEVERVSIKDVLDALERGEISVDEAVDRIKGSG